MKGKKFGTVLLIVKNGDDVKAYVGQSGNVAQRMIQHFNPKRGKFTNDMVEQLVILHKYTKEWKEYEKLLNKRNSVGGRFDLKTEKGLKNFYEEA